MSPLDRQGRASGRARDARGFSLLEAMIALTIASLLMILVSQVFLAQNQFYRDALGRNLADDAVRTTADLLGSELRGGLVGSVTAATPRRLVVKAALAVGGVCDRTGSVARALMPGITQADSTEATGYATRDSVGGWAYTARSWAAMVSDKGSGPAADCESEGVDTTGYYDDFVELNIVGTAVGDLLMVYRQAEYEIKASTLDDGYLALYREVFGNDIEFVTGLMSGSGFEYQIGVGGSWTANPSPSELDSIRAVRVTVVASGQGDSAQAIGYSATQVFSVPLQARD